MTDVERAEPDLDLDAATVERIARNDSIFRAANEGISAVAAGTSISRIPCVCECADETCRQLVPLTRAEYESIRADPTLFLNVPGHVASAQGAARVVEARDGYDVVQKVGRAAEIVKETAPEPRER